MAFRNAQVLLALAVTLPLSIDANGVGSTGISGSGFLARQGSFDVAATLQELLNNRNGTSSWAQRWRKTEAHMSRSVVALPKNENGKLSLQAVRYLVHGYFVQEHGWLIRGLGPHAPRDAASELHQASILRDKAPGLLEALLQARQSDAGLSLTDAVAMATTLERLIFEECLELLQAAYELNGFVAANASLVDSIQLREVLLSFLLLFEMGIDSDVSDPEVHSLMKEGLNQTFGTPDNFWEKLDEFQQGAVDNFVFSQRSLTNPFVPQTFSFETVSHLVEIMSHTYGKWQDSECQLMKEELMRLDSEGFGRVPLSTFYTQQEHVVYKFGESVDYLRTIGALDERHSQDPQVIIANYLAGPSNCVAGSSYYSVCCLSECEGLLAELEDQIRAPSATPEQLAALVGSMSSSTVEGPRRLPKALIRRLSDIAKVHDGQVPLHGRLFSQWLHYAFPLECQYPQQLSTEDVLTPLHWQEKGHTATAEERDHYIKLASSAAANAAYMPVGDGADEAEQELPQWSEEEVLPFMRKATLWNVAVGWTTMLARVVAALSLLWAVLKTSIAVLMSTASAKRGEAVDASKAHFV